jgi:hypothetical protein
MGRIWVVVYFVTTVTYDRKMFYNIRLMPLDIRLFNKMMRIFKKTWNFSPIKKTFFANHDFFLRYDDRYNDTQDNDT